MLTKDFCDYLEYHLPLPVRTSTHINLRRCRRDGVLMPDNENDYSTKTVNDMRKIITMAWIDEGRMKGQGLGQRLYTLVIHFGRKSLKRYMAGKEFIDGIPSAEADDWMDFDFENKRIETQLL